VQLLLKRVGEQDLAAAREFEEKKKRKHYRGLGEKKKNRRTRKWLVKKRGKELLMVRTRLEASQTEEEREKIQVG